MRCPECRHDELRVVDSRSTGDAIRRRRECLSCGHRFTTHERAERPILWIVKKRGEKEPYDRDKVLRGVFLACRKRPVDAAAVEQVVARVEAQLEALRSPEILTSDVGEAVMDALRDVDPVAYVRFASVYREFESLEQFVEIVQPLREGA